MKRIVFAKIFVFVLCVPVTACSGFKAASPPPSTRTVDSAQPPTPQSVAITISDTEIDVTWLPPTTSSPTISSYNVYRDGTLLTSVPASQHTFADTSVSPATVYTYQVAAVSSGGVLSQLSPGQRATTIREYLLDDSGGYLLDDKGQRLYGYQPSGPFSEPMILNN